MTVYRGDGKDPVAIATGGVQEAIDNLRDVVIVDTAGRLHVDEEMMEEAARHQAGRQARTRSSWWSTP